MIPSTAGKCVVASAVPYPWPYHGRFDPARTALVACLDGTWRAPSAESNESDVRLRQLATRLQAHGGFVVSVNRTPVRRGIGRSSGIGSRGTAFRASVSVLPAADVLVSAAATSAFFGSELDNILRSNDRQDLIIAGWGLEGPVHSTLRAANDRGYECLLVADASTPVDPDLVVAAGEMVRFSGGIFGAYASTGDVLCAFDEDSVE